MVSESTAMLWQYSEDKKYSLEERVKRAAAYFSKVHKATPKVVFVGTADFREDMDTLAGLEVVYENGLPSEHIVICEQREDFLGR